MSKKSTSAEVYEQIVQSGLIGRMQRVVYQHLYEHGPMTGSELDEELRKKCGGRDSYHKRLAELEKIGCVHIVGTRVCTVSGYKAAEWDTTPEFTSNNDGKQTSLF